jgi:hypothetical protein
MRYLFSFLLLLCCLPGIGQVWRGTITDADTKKPLQGVTVTNTHNNLFIFTDEEGHFDIQGNAGDKITFYCPGYTKETHIIIPMVEGIRLHFDMKLSSRELQEVIIRKQFDTQYQRDSAERYSTYSRTLAREQSGMSSPFSFLAERVSKKGRQMRHFQKSFNSWEGEQFKDSRYTPELVGNLTGFSGDTLARFMNRYPLPLDYARSATDLELQMWIRYNYKQYLVLTDSLRRADTIR